MIERGTAEELSTPERKEKQCKVTKLASRACFKWWRNEKVVGYEMVKDLRHIPAIAKSWLNQTSRNYQLPLSRPSAWIPSR